MIQYLPDLCSELFRLYDGLVPMSANFHSPRSTMNRHYYRIIAICSFWIFAAAPVLADGLDLTTGGARVVGENKLSLENLSFDGRFYNAEIELNLDGTYNVNSVEEVVIASTATYELTFDSTWSAATHPYQYPSGLSHYSGLIGGTHNGKVRFWELSKIASPGMERMAELGSKSPLRDEVESAIESGDAEYLLSGGGIGSSPGLVTMQFQISQGYPFVTLVSMIAPSPDWFVGVSALGLIENGQWIDELVIPLYAYDAGSDSGVSYTSSNSDTNPKAQISRLEELPFLVNGEITPLGTFTFRRLLE